MTKRGWLHVDDPILVGRRLKKARLNAGLSQRELAFEGCTAVYICRIESGDRVPSLQVLRELARRLKVDEEDLAGTKTAADQAREERYKTYVAPLESLPDEVLEVVTSLCQWLDRDAETDPSGSLRQM